MNNILYGESRAYGVLNKVQLKIDDENSRIYGYIGKGKFVWQYNLNIYPHVIGNDKVEYRRMAKEYVLDTLITNGISLYKYFCSCKVFNKDNLIIKSDDENFCIININGFIRGFKDNQQFIWNPLKYKKAVYVREGDCLLYLDASFVREWIKESGNGTLEEVLYKLRRESIDDFDDELPDMTEEEKTAILKNKNVYTLEPLSF